MRATAATLGKSVDAADVQPGRELDDGETFRRANSRFWQRVQGVQARVCCAVAGVRRNAAADSDSRAATRLPDLRNSHHHRAQRAWGIEIWIFAEGSFFLRSHHGALPYGIFVTADAFFWHGGHRCGICGERHRFLAADCESDLLHPRAARARSTDAFCDSPDSFR